MWIIDCLSTIVFILPLYLDDTKVIILILWRRTFQLEYWRTFQLVSTPYRRRHWHRPPQEERDITQYPAHARPARLHPAIGSICQVRQRHRPRTSPVKPPGRKSQDAHCHQLCPQDVPRHAPYRRGQIR